MATKIFFGTMLLTQVIIKPNLRLVRCTADFIKIVGVSEFPIGLCWWLVESANRQYKSMGNLLCSRIFIKSAVDPINLKFGVMISCHSNKR